MLCGALSCDQAQTGRKLRGGAGHVIKTEEGTGRYKVWTVWCRLDPIDHFHLSIPCLLFFSINVCVLLLNLHIYCRPWLYRGSAAHPPQGIVGFNIWNVLPIFHPIAVFCGINNFKFPMFFLFSCAISGCMCLFLVTPILGGGQLEEAASLPFSEIVAAFLWLDFHSLSNQFCGVPLMLNENSESYWTMNYVTTDRWIVAETPLYTNITQSHCEQIHRTRMGKSLLRSFGQSCIF